MLTNIFLDYAPVLTFFPTSFSQLPNFNQFQIMGGGKAVDIFLSFYQIIMARCVPRQDLKPESSRSIVLI